MKISSCIFIEKCKRIHGDKYDYSMINYINNKTKVKIICSKHGEFLQIPSDHLRGKGCISCGGRKKLNNEEFIKNSIKIHGNLYNYDKVKIINCRSKVIIECKIHGDFQQTPDNHINGNHVNGTKSTGNGCPKCSGRLKSNNIEFIEKSNLIHDNLYHYDFVYYINAKTKVDILCNKHGV